MPAVDMRLPEVNLGRTRQPWPESRFDPGLSACRLRKDYPGEFLAGRLPVAQRLGDATIVHAGTDQAPVTELSGYSVDQAARFGILNTLYDLGLPLLSYECKAAPSRAGG